MGNSSSQHALFTKEIFPFFLEDDFCAKARSLTSTTSVEDFSLCDCAEVKTSKRPQHCWGGWFLEQRSIERLRPSLISVLDSDQESSCTIDTPHVSSFDMEEDDSIHKLKQQGCVFEQHGRLDEAVATYHSLLELVRATGGSESLGDIHWRTGVAQWKRGAYNESLRHLDQAMFAYQLRSGNSTASNMDISEILLATGRVHLSMGNRSQAKRCFRRAVDLLEEYSGRHDDENRRDTKPLLAKLMHAIGTVYEAGGNFDKAVSYCQVALDLQRQTNQCEGREESAATLLTFGSLHEEKGDYELALEVYTEAFDICKSLAPDQCTSIDVGVLLTSIGWIHFLKGNQQDAADAYHEALVLFRSLGDHRSAADVMIQLGKVYIAQGYYDEAASVYEEALQMQRHVLGEHHEDVVSTLFALVSTLEHLHHWSRAIEFLHYSLRVRRQTMGPNDVLVGDILVQLGDIHILESNHTAADQRFADARKVYEIAQLDNSDARVLRVLEALNRDKRC